MAMLRKSEQKTDQQRCSFRVKLLSILLSALVFYSTIEAPKAEAGFDYYNGFNTVWNDLSIGQQCAVSFTIQGMILAGGIGGIALGALGSFLVKHEDKKAVIMVAAIIIGLVAGGFSGYMIALDAEKPDLKFGVIDAEHPPAYLAHFTRAQLEAYNGECEEYTIVFNRVAKQLQQLAISAKESGQPVDLDEVNGIMFGGFQGAVDSNIISQDTADVAAAMQEKAFGSAAQGMFNKIAA